MRPVVNTEKQYVQYTVTSVGLGSLGQEFIAEALEVPATASKDVRVGAKISAIYVEIWLGSDDAAQGSFNLTVEKVPGNSAFMTYAQSILLDDYPNKKNVFYTTQGINPPNVQSAIPVIRQWIKIPKSKQRMGLGDKFVVNIAGITNGLTYCGFSLFKQQF